MITENNERFVMYTFINKLVRMVGKGVLVWFFPDPLDFVFRVSPVGYIVR